MSTVAHPGFASASTRRQRGARSMAFSWHDRQTMKLVPELTAALPRPLGRDNGSEPRRTARRHRRAPLRARDRGRGLAADHHAMMEKVVGAQTIVPGKPAVCRSDLIIPARDWCAQDDSQCVGPSAAPAITELSVCYRAEPPRCSAMKRRGCAPSRGSARACHFCASTRCVQSCGSRRPRRSASSS